MKNIKIVFVILHYYTEDDTIKCIESIKKLNQNQNIEIMIVDNFSPNESGKRLKMKYENDKNIHIILSNKNLGFANGNNLGFKYAKEKLNADFIVLCNNDTYIIQKDFISKIDEAYQKYKYAVLGPKIILKDNTINKLYTRLPTTKEFKREIHIFRRNLFFNYIGIESVLRRIKKAIMKEKSTEENSDSKKLHKNIILHGCFLVFSPIYIKRFDGLDDRTFMYREEELLAIRLQKNNLISIYDPDIEIFHSEYSSTKAVKGTDQKKRRFFYKNQLKSCKIVMKELKNGEKYDKKNSRKYFVSNKKDSLEDKK